jgi:hypothetical protein
MAVRYQRFPPKAYSNFVVCFPFSLGGNQSINQSLGGNKKTIFKGLPSCKLQVNHFTKFDKASHYTVVWY